MRRLLRLNLLYATSLALMLLASCAKSDLDGENPEVDQFIELELSISGSSGVEIGTKSTTVALEQECRIYFGYFFIFDGTSGDYVSHQRFSESKVSKNRTTSPIINLQLASQIIKGSKIVMIMNQQPTGVGDIGTTSYTTVADLFPLLEETSLVDSRPLADGTIGAASFKMPMYGFVDSWVAGNDIPITRAMAKLQVKLAADFGGSTTVSPGANNFTDLSQVKYKIFNYATLGNIAPMSDYSINPVASGLAEPLTLAEIQALGVDDIVNEVTKIGAAADNASGRSYLYEFDYATKTIGGTPAVIENKTSSDKRLAIILAAKDRFYRLDLYKKDPTGDLYQDIIRNNHYSIIITDVNDNGYASVYDAFRFPASNVEYELILDSEHDQITTSNGVYSLSVDSPYDNYLSSTSADVTLNSMYVIGQTETGLDGIDATAIPRLFTLESIESLDGSGTIDVGVSTGKWIVSAQPTGADGLGEAMSPLVWNIKTTADVAGKAKFKFKVEFGNLFIEREVIVELLGASQAASSRGKFDYVIDIPSGEVPNSGDWIPDGEGQALVIKFSDDFTKLNIQDNITPTGWIKAGSTEVDLPTTYDSRPTFAPRRVQGNVVTRTDKGTTTTRLNLSQAAAEYRGRTGAIITSLNFDARMGDIISSTTDERRKRVINNK